MLALLQFVCFDSDVFLKHAQLQKMSIEKKYHSFKPLG